MARIITLEEHYCSLQVVNSSEEGKALYAQFPPHIYNKLQDLGQDRIKDLDDGNVSMQVLSHGPGDVSESLSKAANDQLAAAVGKNPSRLAGFALLPIGEPEAAAKELERCVKDLNFVGALIDNHLDGVFYDDERFWPMFQKAEELDVPIYIHPSFASDAMLEHYKGNYDDSIAMALSAYGWGWHSETAVHILRLYASGLFDRFPKLKIIIGHMGELLPFQIDRVMQVTTRWGSKKRNFQEVWSNNLWITTSGMFSINSLKCLVGTTSMDRVLFSIDYPFSTTQKGYEFMKEVEASGIFTAKELEMFAYKNAEKLLKLKATS